jgi:hypothetical protein
MKCTVCGIDYGMTHNCAGIAPATNPEDHVRPPSGFAPLHYLREALRIATWDDAAIRRTSHDPTAIWYGCAIWAIANSIPFLIQCVELYSKGEVQRSLQMLIGLAVVLPFAGIFALLQVGACFLIAKWFMAGEGRFVDILRPLLLGSIVLVLLVIPYVGVFAASIAWIAVFAMVFQEIDGVAPLSAYLLSAAVGILSRALEAGLESALR